MDSKVRDLLSRTEPLVSKFEREGEIGYIDEAIFLDREALQVCSSDDSNRVFYLSLLAIHLGYRFNRFGKMLDLEEAIVLDKEALRLRPPGHPDRSATLFNLPLRLFARYNRLDKVEDINEAIVLDQELLALCPPGHPDRSNCFNNLAIHLSVRYEKLGAMEDLDHAISLTRDALALTPSGHPNRSKPLDTLATVLLNRYRRLGTVEDLTTIINLNRDALECCPPGHPNRAVSLNNIAVSLFDRYRQLGTVEDLDEAIAHNRDALVLRPPGHPDRPISLDNLALYLSERFKQAGAIKDLDDAIALEKDAVVLQPPGHSHRWKTLHDLALVLSHRYLQLGEMADLEEAIRLGRESLELLPHGHPSRSNSLSDLALHLSTRFKKLGIAEDLNEVILLDREALALRPLGHPDRPASLHSLAVGLASRYGQLGGMDDLNESIMLSRDALALCPSTHPNRPTFLSNLASSLSSRYQRLRTTEDLDQAIVLDREALGHCPIGHPKRSTQLSALANRLSSRFERLGKMMDIDEAISLGREALAICPPSHQDRFGYLNNLALHLSTRYKQRKEIGNLNESIALAREGLTLHVPGNPHWSPSLINLAVDLSTRYKLLGEKEDYEELFCLYSKLARLQQTASLQDVFAANMWTEVAEEYRHPTTLLAYETSFRLLVKYFASFPSLPHHLSILKDLVSTLAADAFSAHIRNHAPTRAVELLEQGRGVFWSQLSHLRPPLEDVIASGPEGKILGEKFTQLTSSIRDALDSPGADQHDRVWHLNFELQRVVSDIRKLPGLSHFLLPLLFSDLQRAACDGPVIVVNASRYGCDALIILYDRDPVRIPLSVTKKRIRQLSTNLRTLTVRSKTMVVTDQFAILLREIWDEVVSRIVDVLQPMFPHRSRIWWCPTAEFSLVPLHAAGPYRKGQHNLSHLYVSSYTPTLAALILARRPSPSVLGVSRKRFVAIGQAQATGENELQSVGTELANIGQRIAGRATFTRIEDTDANMSRFAEELSRNEWVHLACHGLPNRKEPFKSAFALYDGHFTIERIMRCELENPEFAYLSACHTTVGYEESPDEVIHLASAMQFAGFRSVIGTMWAVDDGQTNKIASLFYDNMVGPSGQLDHTRAALALHRTMRKVVDVPFDQKILYIHIGA